MKLKDAVPNFYNEMLTAIIALGRSDVADQLPELTLARHTYDDNVHAMYIYVGGTRKLNRVEKTTISAKHEECLELKEIDGVVVLNIDDFNRVMGIEVVDRPDVSSELK